MIRAYSEIYLNDAKQNLADFFDYAINDCGISEELFVKLFLQSGYSEQFERGNPAVIAGISGIELAKKVMNYAYKERKFPERIFREERSDVYWAGWILAEYQWESAKRFKDIFSRISFSEIVSMYTVFHEMDTERFFEELDRRYDTVKTDTHLKQIRENRALSQAELSKMSGVKLRSIQMYEQKVNNIDKAQAGTLYKLSRVLGCTIEDLLESPYRE